MPRRLTVIKQNRKRRRRMFYSRVLTMSFVVGIFAISGFFIYSERIKKLRESEVYLAQLQQEKDEILAQQDYYRSEIHKLENEDYIAMLARERYFKSLQNEVLFRFGNAEASESTD